MVHLTCHLVAEAKLGSSAVSVDVFCGKVFKTLEVICAKYVTTRRLHKKLLPFFSKFLEGIETRINRPRSVNDYREDRCSTNSSSICPPVGKGVGAETFELSLMMAKGKAVDRGRMWTKTHWRNDGSYVTEPAAKEIGMRRFEGRRLG
ncbi:hypothetical protein KY290_010212 [Solanum tuberosum]|uniref:DUF4218 domain-containing protein n=1 Tax=Solanum tuberosum TaxID=4113 RepID=A0ABQ7VXT6_SOLTU|nr:hypothetical protein KY289_010597 [Solanum tuberosum]KAH0773075.1 hypothetical protein KY290_010212 [Solanum tuberosum]